VAKAPLRDGYVDPADPVSKSETVIPEEVAERSLLDAGDVYAEYPDPRHATRTWTAMVADLNTMTKSQLLDLRRRTGVSITTLKAWRRGRRPRTRNRRKLVLWSTQRK
jgi:hypothetical protein